MKRLTLFLLAVLLLALIVPVTSAQEAEVQQDPEALTVTIPPVDGGDGETIPSVVWSPDNLILIAGIAVVILFSVFGGVVIFLGNKLYLSIPQWAQPGAENIVREGIVDALEAGKTIVTNTTTTLDDEILKVIEERVYEIVNRVFDNPHVARKVAIDANGFTTTSNESFRVPVNDPELEG